MSGTFTYTHTQLHLSRLKWKCKIVYTLDGLCIENDAENAAVSSTMAHTYKSTVIENEELFENEEQNVAVGKQCVVVEKVFKCNGMRLIESIVADPVYSLCTKCNCIFYFCYSAHWYYIVPHKRSIPFHFFFFHLHFFLENDDNNNNPHVHVAPHAAVTAAHVQKKSQLKRKLMQWSWHQLNCSHAPQSHLVSCICSLAVAPNTRTQRRHCREM